MFLATHICAWKLVKKHTKACTGTPRTTNNRLPFTNQVQSPTLKVIPNDITDTLNHIRLMIKVLFLMFGVLNSVRWFPSFFGYKINLCLGEMWYMVCTCRAVLNTAELQIYLGLIVRIWASLGLYSSIFPIFHLFLSLFIGNLWFFWLRAVQVWCWLNDSIPTWWYTP